MAWVQSRTTKSGSIRYRAYWRDPSGKVNGKVFAHKRGPTPRLEDDRDQPAVNNGGGNYS